MNGIATKTGYKQGVHHNIKKANQLFLLALGIYVSFQINGFWGSIPGLRAKFNIILSGTIIILSVLRTPNFFNKFLINKAYLVFVTIVIICFVDLWIGSGSTFILSFFPVVVYLSAYTYMSNKKASSAFVIWFLLNIIYKIVLTFIWLSKDELIVKRYDHIGYAMSDGVLRSLVGYGAIYLIVPLIIIMLATIRQSRSLTKVLLIITTILSIILVYKSQVSMMVFALTTLLLSYFILRKSVSIDRRTIILLIAIIVIYIYRIHILTYMANLGFLGDTVQNRLSSLASVLSNDIEYVYSEYGGSMVVGDSVINRFYAYAESLRAMFHNFFLGYLTPGALVGAGHSSIFDMISKYSIFSVIPLIILLISRYKELLSKHPHKVIPIILVFGYILVISCLNNLALSTVFLLVYILIPQLFDLVAKPIYGGKFK